MAHKYNTPIDSSRCKGGSPIPAKVCRRLPQEVVVRVHMRQLQVHMLWGSRHISRTRARSKASRQNVDRTLSGPCVFPDDQLERHAGLKWIMQPEDMQLHMHATEWGTGGAHACQTTMYRDFVMVIVLMQLYLLFAKTWVYREGRHQGNKQKAISRRN